MDAMGSVCCGRAKLHHGMLKDAPGSVHQELLLSPIFSPQPADVKQAQEAVKVAPQVVRLLVDSLPSRASKNSIAAL